MIQPQVNLQILQRPAVNLRGKIPAADPRRRRQLHLLDLLPPLRVADHKVMWKETIEDNIRCW